MKILTVLALVGPSILLSTLSVNAANGISHVYSYYGNTSEAKSVITEVKVKEIMRDWINKYINDKQRAIGVLVEEKNL